MDMQNNWKKILSMLLIGVLLALPVCAGADLGDFSGSYDYGDFGGGSDWGSDWGDSDSDWDSDYDSDWGSSSPGYVYIDDGDSSSGGGIGFGTIILVVIVIILIARANAKKNGGSAPRPAGAQATAQSALKPMAEYQAVDPNFSESELTEKISNLYVQMQNACTDRDITSLRPYFTDTLFAQFDRQIDALKAQKRINYIERISVLGVTLRGWQSDENDDRIVATVRTRITDYTVDEETNEVVSGSRDQEKFMTYEYILTRTRGRTTQKGEEMTAVNCPNCGAPLEIAHSAKCPYCDTLIELEDHDWVVSSIKGLAQQTIG